MTTVLDARPRRAPGRGLTAATVAVLVAGEALLLARPALLPSPGHDPTARLVVLFVTLGLVGARWPLPGRPSPPLGWAAPLALGALAFAVGRLTTGGIAAQHPLFARSLLLNALAAVAEEAFFRRLLYGWLERHGAGVAIGVSAAAFAVAHVTVWGWWVLPLDLAAGLVLSWQRAASGRWAVPAATHVLANALALL